jgi:hypothetical protein
VDEEDWQPARLIPVSGISGAEEQERRGVSALLAVLGSVREFGRAITGQLGAPSGSIETYIEVPFQLGERQVRPDGLIRVMRGKKEWTALVEVKTGRNDLLPAQLTDYVDVAREHGFDVVLTVSNQLSTAPGEHPTSIDRKKLRKVSLRHLSWSQIHTEAVIERINRSVADPDQAWILSELIRYLEHPRSGAVDFDDMGPAWVAVRDGAKDRTLRAGDKSAAEVVAKFGQLTSFAGMRLSRRLGVQVQPALTRAQLNDLGAHIQAGVAQLVDRGTLNGALRVPDTVAPIEITADLRAGLVTCAVTVPAPGQGRNATRVNWLVRQLAKAPDAVQVEAVAAWARSPGACMPITEVRKRPNGLIDDSNKELKSFTVRLSAVSGTKRGQQRGSFVGSVLGLVDNFYETVVQHLKPWTPPTPSQRKLADADGAASDQISGELPLKSVQRASSPPDWDPPEQPADDAGSDLVYARTDQFDAGAELDAATPARSPDGEWSDGRAEIVADDVLD